MDLRNEDVSLQDYLAVLRRRRWLIVSVLVLSVVVAWAYASAQPPLYEARAELALAPVRPVEDAAVQDARTLSASAVETERLTLLSRPVADRVAEDLGLPDHRSATEGVRVEAVRDAGVLRIVVADPDPAFAAARADAFADAYLAERRDRFIDDLLAARANLEARAEGLRASIAELDAQISDIEDEDGTGALTIQRDALLAQLGQSLGQAAQLGDASQSITGGGTVLNPAEVPGLPVSPRPLLATGLGLAVGLVLGLGLAFARDYFDDVVRDESVFKRATGGLPVLGRIPSFSAPADERLVSIADPHSPASEGYRELSAAVRFLLTAQQELGDRDDADRPSAGGRSLLVVSGSAGEGKTATAANLSVAAAWVGLRVVLVDADLRKASVGSRFGLGHAAGLTDVLLSGAHVGDYLLDVGVENLRVLQAGTVPPNPAALLASPSMRRVEAELRSSTDLVIYDSPAVLAVSDALELGRFVDLAIIVGRHAFTSRRSLQAAVERLEQVATPLAGSVFNDSAMRESNYYYYDAGQHDGWKSRSDRRRHRGRWMSPLRTTKAKPSTPIARFAPGGVQEVQPKDHGESPRSWTSPGSSGGLDPEQARWHEMSTEGEQSPSPARKRDLEPFGEPEGEPHPASQVPKAASRPLERDEKPLFGPPPD